MLMLTAVLLVLTSPVIQREDFSRDLGTWYATDPPAKGSDQWIIANGDVGHDWAVTLGTAGPRVDLFDRNRDSPLPFAIRPGLPGERLAGERIAQKVVDGWLVGFNDGEFGAALWWFSPDGTRRYHVSDDHVVGFAPTKVGLLAVEGLAHGVVSRGKIVRLFCDERGRWVSESFLDLGHAPQVAAKGADDSLVIATTSRLLRVIPSSRTIEVILDQVFWGGLYPNSMVITREGEIIMGMRHGVAKIQCHIRPYKMWWLLPSKDVLDQKPGDRFR